MLFERAVLKIDLTFCFFNRSGSNKKLTLPSFHYKSPSKLKHIIHWRKRNQMRYS